MDRRLAEGKTMKEVIRCLKRFVARELYRTLRAGLAASQPALDIYRNLPAYTRASCLLGLRRGLAETSRALQGGRLSRHRRGVATK